MSRTLHAAVSSDIDTLASIYKGQGCRRPGGYTYAEMRMGLEKMSDFLASYDVKATLFMVGEDFRQTINHDAIRAVAREGHEIANHSFSHTQGFRLLTPEEKEMEIKRMEEVCKNIVGRRPAGFRSPGWNIGDDTLPILQRRGYLYDSSVHPTLLMPLLKFLHWCSMSSRSRSERTTMGHMKYMFAPVVPYRTSRGSFSRRGQDGLVEFPVTVTPVIRMPFFATFLLATGLALFEQSYRALKTLRRPIHFMFHLSDFVDYSHPDLIDQVPPRGGVYVPKALQTNLEKKMELFRRAMDIMTKDYSFLTLEKWAQEIETRA